MVSPVDVKQFEKLLRESHYDENKINKLIIGFSEGFDIGYDGPKDVTKTAQNLKLHVGDETILWNKVMKEVKEKRFAGPYREVPFENYIQSPIGLVPKEGGDGTRLIFHLSYPRNGQSINACTPRELCTVKYPDFDKAIKMCLHEIGMTEGNSPIFLGKSDMRSAFRNLGLNPQCFRFLIMKARSPLDNQWYYFIDKCLPFGASISCALFQEFSNAVAHIVRFKTKKELVNYLDDYLFAAFCKWLCNSQIDTFLAVCEQIKFPVSMEKTYWASSKLTFLGLLIDAVNQLICLPTEKIDKAENLINKVIQSKKSTVHEIQKLCGLLNFLCRAIVPGRTFTRRIYSLTTDKFKKLKQHHHVRLTYEVRQDLEMWRKFLKHPMAVCRPFADFSENEQKTDKLFFTDASKSVKLGCGGWCEEQWFSTKWDPNWIKEADPSIAFLELYALACGYLLWASRFRNQKITINCDNQSVVQMVNNATSGCKNCMTLIRIIVMESMVQNVKLKVRFVDTKSNGIADALSRQQWTRFKNLTKHLNMKETSEPIPQELWPISKIWR